MDATSVAVAQAKGVALAEDAIQATMAYVDRAAPAGRPSMAVDLEQGKRLELPWLSGAVVRMGNDVGIETPVHRFIGMALKHQVLGSQ